MDEALIIEPESAALRSILKPNIFDDIQQLPFQIISIPVASGCSLNRRSINKRVGDAQPVRYPWSSFH